MRGRGESVSEIAALAQTTENDVRVHLKLMGAVGAVGAVGAAGAAGAAGGAAKDAAVGPAPRP
jgi:hypothetical protein